MPEFQPGEREAAFLVAIKHANLIPDRSTAQLVFADWLSDHQRDTTSDLWRWLGNRSRWPAHREKYFCKRMISGNSIIPVPFSRVVPVAYSWAWYPDRGAKDIMAIPESAKLPRLVFLALRKSHDHAYYPSLEAAITGLGEGLEYLKGLVRPGLNFNPATAWR